MSAMICRIYYLEREGEKIVKKRFAHLVHVYNDKENVLIVADKLFLITPLTNIEFMEWCN